LLLRTSGREGGMVKVSVVVPVFNPGRYLDDLLASLDRQSMPKGDFEVVFVDDGSTDGTGKRLDSLTASAPNMRVIHIPNSGWPGRPRNVGIDAARGQFVQFVDQDDELGDEALQRLYDYAMANGSDVVVGKEGRRGKTWSTGPLFTRDRPHATLEKDPALLLLLTPHKMFRRAFLLEQHIRFLEGPRRLEDHAFVMTAYFRARVISVLAGYTCYYWHRRENSAGSRPKDWQEYYTSLRDTLDVVERHTSPGPFRDRLMAHWYRTKVLRRLGPSFAGQPEHDARALFEELRVLTQERFPPDLDTQRQLGPLRLRAALLRAGAFAQARELAGEEQAMYLTEQVDDLRVANDRVELAVTATLRRRDGSPVQLEQGAGAISQRPLVALEGLGLAPASLDVTHAYQRLTVTVYARHRSSDQRFALPGRSRPVDVGADGLLLVGATAQVTLDPARTEEGQPMRSGRWWLEVELAFGGWVVSCPIRSRLFSARFDDGDVTVSTPGPSYRPVTRLVRSVAFARGRRG
jgi:glycosyltransferase involved in cell wall biosynthesis